MVIEAELAAATEARRLILAERLERVMAQEGTDPKTIRQSPNRQQAEPQSAPRALPLNSPAPVCMAIRQPWESAMLPERNIQIVQPWTR